jgi:hypothetical protein
MGCLSALSGSSRKIAASRRRTGAVVQLRLDLAESPAPAVALWELLGEAQRQTAMALLAALIARSVAADEVPCDE